jgi:GntR family transcriptional regulator/GntR family frlABCD operon transcriptional regulator
MFPLSEIEMQSGCIYIERLRLVDNVPLFYDVNYLPNINLPRFTSRNFEDKSLFDMLRRYYQIEIKGGDQKLKAIPASESVSKFLNIPVGHPVLSLERKMNTNRPGFNIFSSIPGVSCQACARANPRKQHLYAPNQEFQKNQ